MLVMCDVIIIGSVVLLLMDIVMDWWVIFGVISIVCDYLRFFILLVEDCGFFLKVRNNIGDVCLLNEDFFFLLIIMVVEEGMF